MPAGRRSGPPTGGPPAADERERKQLVQAIERLLRRRRGADQRLDRRQGDRACTDSESDEQRLLPLIEQLIRPLHRRSQTALPAGASRSPRSAERADARDYIQHLRAEKPHAGGRELDRQRHIVQRPQILSIAANVAPRSDPVVGHDPKRARSRNSLTASSAWRGVRATSRSAPTRSGTWLVTRMRSPPPGAKQLTENRRPGHQLLEVVKDDQRRLATETLRQYGGQRQ